jgi:DNA-binding transcriptional regulator YhcF (GntR family)
MKTPGYLGIKIDFQSALPVYEQVKRAIKLAILTGTLKDGEAVASIRDLAQRLQINPNTIIKIYGQLETEGFLASRPGLGHFVRFEIACGGNDRSTLFETLSEDFVHQAVELGFTREDVQKRIDTIFDRTTGKPRHGQ